MANSNILNNIPFGDTVLKSTVTRLEKETPEVQYYVNTATVSNPTTTPVTLLEYSTLYPTDRPYELRLEALVALTNNLNTPADQEFVIDIYDLDADSSYITLATLDVDSTISDPVATSIKFTYRAQDLTHTRGNLEYSVITDYNDTDVAGQVTFAADRATTTFPQNFAIRVTAETGTTSTIVIFHSAKVSLDRQVWN